jgi:alpha-L-arabinofuranosidase
MLDIVASISEDEENITVSIVNKDLYLEKNVSLSFAKGKYELVRADVVTSDDVRAVNTFDEPRLISDRALDVSGDMQMTLPAHSVARICLKKSSL